MDIEELQVKISASTSGFGEAIAKVKAQLKSVDEAADKLNQKLTGKGNANNAGEIVPKVDTAALEKQLDTLTSKVDSKANEMVDKIESKTQSLMQKITAETDKLMSSIIKGISAIKIPYIGPTDETPKIPNTGGTSSPRAPPKVRTIDVEALKSQIANLEATLDNINARIDRQKVKLVALREAYSNAFNPNVKNKIQEQILKTEASINKMIGQSDKLGFKLADLDEKLASVGTGAKKASGGLNSVSNKAKETGNNISKATQKTNGLFGMFKNLGNSSKTATKSMHGMNYGLSGIMRQMMTWMIILPMIVKGLSAMCEGLLNNLKTNEQFNTSLNQIKTNLMVAFTPIYQAILPAINSLMSALATATAYIASFISALFGKTYQQSYKATQQLIDAKKEMGAYGDSAKKASKEMKGLAAFDEINSLNKSGSNGDDSKVPILTQPSLDMSQVDSKTKGWADEFKRIMGEIFEPFKEAWQREGQNTIDSMHKALTGIWDLVKAIGSSFLTVWTNGTGTQILTTTLQILQNIFNLIGKIGESFTNAWKKDDTGTKIIQNLADGFQNILDVIKGIGDALNEVWDEKGDQIAESVTKVVLALSDNFKHLTEIIKDVWDSEGAEAFRKILYLISDLIISIADSYSKRISPIINDLLDGFKPVLEQLIGLIGDIAKDFDDLVNYLHGDGHFFVDFWQQITVNPVVEKFKLAFDAISEIIRIARDILKGLTDFIAGTFTGDWSLAWQGIKEIGEGIWQGIQDSFGVAMDFLKTKLHLTWLESSTDTETIWSSIKEGLETKWNNLTTSASQKWDSIKQSISDACTSTQETTALKWSNIKDYIVTKWGEIGTEASTNWENIKITVCSKLDELKTKNSETWENIKTEFNNIVTFVKTNFSTGWSNAWNDISDIFSKVFNGLVGIAKKPINEVIKMVNKLIEGINSFSINIPDSKLFGDFAGESVGFHIPTIPKLARGGIVDSATTFIAGEHGKEAVMPLENNTGWITQLAAQIASFIGTNSNSVNTEQQGGDIIFMIDGSVIGKVAIKQLRKMQRQGNITVIPT